MAGKRVAAVTSNGPVNSVGKLEWDPSITNPLFIDMVDLLRCHQCKKLNYNVNYLSKCDHILCNECKNTMSFRKCPICKVPAMEIKKDLGYESLIKDIRTLNQHFLKIHFNSDKNAAQKTASIDKRVLSPPRPVNLNPFPFPTKKKDDIAVEIEASQNSTQLSEATSVFSQEKVDDKDSDGETVGFVNKRKGRIGKAIEKAATSKRQKITSDTNDSGDTDGGVLDKNKKADKERGVEKEKEKEKVNKDKEEKEKEKEKAKEKEAQKKLEKERKEAEKLEKEKAKKLEKEKKEEEREAAKERQKERIRERERAKERAAEKAKEKAKIKESAETKDQDKEIESGKDKDKTNEKDAEKEDDKTRSNRKRRVPAKEVSKETETEEKAQKDDSKAKQVETATKRRGKQVEEEQKSESRETKATSRVNRKVTEEKEKEQKAKELDLEDKRVTRSTPTKSEPTKETGDLTGSHRRAGRTAKNLENVIDKIEDKQDKNVPLNNNEEDKTKTKTKGPRKSVTFSPAKEAETLVSPRKSPRSNKGNMMYNRRPDEVSTFPVRARPDVNKSKEKETESELETPKSANNKATSKGRAKQKVTKEAEASAEEDEDIFVKPKAKGKRAARQDPTDPSPLKRQRRGKDTSDESDVSSSSVQTPSIRSTASTTSSRANSRILVASTLLTEDQKKILEKFKNTLGIKVTTDFPNSVSHLVTKADTNKRAIRSLKYMKALLSNKWLLSFDWINACLKAGEIVSEEPFELAGTTKQSDDTLGVPKLSRTSKKKLFSGISFHFDGKFKGPDLPGLDELKEIVVSGGGTILDNNSRLNSALRKNEKVVIVKDKIKEDDKSHGNSKIIDTPHLLSIVTTFNTNDLFN